MRCRSEAPASTARLSQPRSLSGMVDTGGMLSFMLQPLLFCASLCRMTLMTVNDTQNSRRYPLYTLQGSDPSGLILRWLFGQAGEDTGPSLPTNDSLQGV